jgi:hypothetical protein
MISKILAAVVFPDPIPPVSPILSIHKTKQKSPERSSGPVEQRQVFVLFCGSCLIDLLAPFQADGRFFNFHK